MRRSRVTFGVVAVLVVVVGVLGGRLFTVHRAYGEWALTPSATPPRLLVNGREYQRSGSLVSLPAGSVPLLEESSGAIVYGPTSRFAPTVVVVKTSTDLIGYSLMGGP